ncbi:hypothetical protein IFM89_029841 [Coptis chinensis]|uniref:DUF3444 domain-containing protein n=1 Tax=Coptis chinensis TaxID=261450 RepID=A0A835LRU3_9MAGN|nr:hypothetical protein IFM89_029841 [Coptis chinensis]
MGSQKHTKPSTVVENQSEATSKEEGSETVKPDGFLVDFKKERKLKKSKESAPLEQISRNGKENCIKNNQMWAVYDDTDGMPRFYAWIKKVFSPVFKVKITWLEANPDSPDEIKWVDAQLPASCGKFKLGKTETIEGVNMFSHMVLYMKKAGVESRRLKLMLRMLGLYQYDEIGGDLGQKGFDEVFEQFNSGLSFGIWLPDLWLSA